MRRIIVHALLAIGALAAAQAADGTLSVRKLSDVWVVTRPDGVVIAADQSTFGLPEAMAYAAGNGNPPMFVYCPGPGSPLIFPSNYTLQIPASVSQALFWYGCALDFNNGSQPGVQMDTFGFGTFKNIAGQVRYSGAGPIVLIRPVTPMPYGAPGAPLVAWSTNNDIDLGTLMAVGGSPEALVKIDPTGVDTTDPYLSPSFAANLANSVKFVGQGYGRAKYGLLLVSPQNGRQLVSQNNFDFYIETVTDTEIKIGTGGAGGLDNGLGSNVYRGNPTKTWAGGNAVISSNAPFSYFWLNSANIEVPNGAPYNFIFGPNAYDNVICTRQAFGGTIGLVLDQNTHPAQPNTFSCGTPSIIPPVAPPPSGDPLKLLLEFAGADGSQSVIDTSAAPHQLSAVGTAQISGNRLLLDAAGARVESPSAGDWQFGPYNFSIEMDIQRSSNGDMTLASCWTPSAPPWLGGWFLRINASNQLWLSWDYGADRHEIVGGSVADANPHTVKAIRTGTLWQILIDGDVVGSGNFADTIDNCGAPLQIGGTMLNGQPFAQYLGTIDNVKITKGP